MQWTPIWSAPGKALSRLRTHGLVDILYQQVSSYHHHLSQCQNLWPWNGYQKTKSLHLFIGLPMHPLHVIFFRIPCDHIFPVYSVQFLLCYTESGTVKIKKTCDLLSSKHISAYSNPQIQVPLKHLGSHGDDYKDKQDFTVLFVSMHIKIWSLYTYKTITAQLLHLICKVIKHNVLRQVWSHQENQSTVQ